MLSGLQPVCFVTDRYQAKVSCVVTETTVYKLRTTDCLIYTSCSGHSTPVPDWRTTSYLLSFLPFLIHIGLYVLVEYV